MFLERFLIGNLWNAGLICVMFILKRVIQNRVSLRFHYYSWFILLASLLISFLPAMIWNDLPSLMPESQQTMATYHIASNTDAVATGDSQWIQDTTLLIVEDNGNIQFEFFLTIIWMTGAISLIGFYWCGSYRLRHIRQFAKYPSAEIQNLFELCCHRLHIKNQVQIRQSRFIAAPVSFGWKTPFVVLPNQGINDLSTPELEHIVLHELSHIRHGDLFTNYLFCGIQALYWFNPLVWLAFRQMRRDREAYCDWAVLNELGNETERIEYGQTILHFAAGCKTRFHTANGLCQNKEQLKYRLEQIVNFHQETTWKKLCGRCLAVFLALLCIFQVPILAYCVENTEEYYTPQSSLTITEADWDSLFGDANGCAVVYDLNADNYTAYNKKEITRRVPPCSTFKIYSALNALEQGTISVTDNFLSWDGAKREFMSWEQDHNLTSAMQQSVNWYFQEFDQAAGIEQLSDFYQSIGYGNSYVGHDPLNYWNGSALKISALEQVELLVKLYRNDFGFRDMSISAVKDSMALSISESLRLYGKTGTGRIDNANVAGWFVGYVETMDNTYFFAVYLCADDGVDGAAATEIAVDILKKMGIELTYPM